MRPQNDLVYEAMCQYPGIVEGYADIDPKAPDACLMRSTGRWAIEG